MAEKKEEKIKRLISRGVEDVIDRAHLERELLSGRKLRVKLGFDPTGAHIHIGRAIVLRKLREFQELGHTIVFIVGDFTAQVGDPSDKLAKRPMLSREDVEKNTKNYKLQVGKIIDLSKAEFHHNSEWLDGLNFREIAGLAETFSVQQMIARRNFKERWRKEEEISLRELLYPLMQGYDSVMVKADVEIGGFDQLFNLKAGRVIQRHYGQKEQDILTCGMLEGTDGRKMSTSWGNVINILDDASDMFGKVMSLRDELIGKYFLLCTGVPEKEIGAMEGEMKKGKLNPRDAKLNLAREIVEIYHGAKAAAEAEKKFIATFSKKEIPEDVPLLRLKRRDISVLELVLFSGIVKSKSEARRLIVQGGFSVNGEKLGDPQQKRVYHGGEIIKIGKKHLFRIK